MTRKFTNVYFEIALFCFSLVTMGLSPIATNANVVSEFHSVISKRNSSSSNAATIPVSVQFVNSLHYEDVAELGVEIKNGKPTLVVRIQKDLKQNPFAIGEATALVKHRDFSEQMEIFEIAYNAQFGSKPARAMVVEIIGELTQKLHQSLTIGTDAELAEYLIAKGNLDPKEKDKLFDPAQKSKIVDSFIDGEQKKLDELNSEVKKDRLERQKKWAEWKQKTNKLDILEARDKKLDDYIRENNRKQARNLLEAYIPWPLLEPYEKGIWESWLEAMENPNAKDSVVLFRGLDKAEHTFKKVDANGEVVELSLIPSMLSYNQGSYTRRLRSIATSREKNGLPESTIVEAKKIPLFYPQLAQHASDPKASPFISFTTSIHTANSFNDKGGIVAIKIDRRRALPNYKGLNGEFEYLVPMIVFPDEVIHYQNAPEKNLADFMDALKKKIKTGIPEKGETHKDFEVRSRENVGLILLESLKSAPKSCKLLVGK